MTTREFGFLTTSYEKVNEANFHFKNYNINIIKISEDELNEYRNKILNKKSMGIIKEKTNLCFRDTLQNINLEKIINFEQVTNLSTLIVEYINKNGELTIDTYESKVDGYLNLNKKSNDIIFGWDDIFCAEPFHLSNYERIKKW